MTRYTFSDDVLVLNPGLPALLNPSKAKRVAKYGNIKTEVDGIQFDSKKEAQHYIELKLLEQAGQISELELQPSFELQAATGDMRPIIYVADFRWKDNHTGKRHVKDSKGFRNATFKLKEKMFRARYPEYVYEVG